jgi:hypothetical protein
VAFTKHYDEQRPTHEPACVHLRSKGVYVTGQLKVPNHPDENGNEYCWCNKTQHVLGPDQVHVERVRCVAGRECYSETYEV